MNALMNLELLMREMTMPETRDVDGAVPFMGEEEFRAFYERTARPLWAYLSRIARDRQQADDFLQEAYYRFYRLGARHEDEKHRRNSLFQIATNLVRDAHRRSRRGTEVALHDDEDDSPGLILASQAPGPEREVATRTDLARAMQHLQPQQRELLWLAYAQGASHDEIGDILGIRSISVRALLLRARRKLASILAGGGDVQKKGHH